MGWSWRIGRIAGIDVYMHFTFLILLGWVAWRHYQETQSGAGALVGTLSILILFGIVVLHELGHALAARRYGIQTRDITLLPIGGVARLERMPEDPAQELVVALAGPAVNVGLAVALFGVIQLRGGLADPSEVGRFGGSFLDQLLWVNVWLAGFNLLPAFPMDGGRELRALLALRMDYVRATQIAAGVGQAMALLFGLVGLFGLPGLFNPSPLLVFIALFVWLGAAEEASLVQMRSALEGIPLSRAMITDFRTLGPHDPLARAVDHVLAGFQQDFPVVEDGRVVGVLTRTDLLTALTRHGQEAPVGEVMQRQFETADPRDMLEGTLARLQTCNCHALPVVSKGQLVGMLTMDNLSELLMIQQALRSRRGEGP
jgi:Zn-dependent protease/CBS domain-containing protein